MCSAGGKTEANKAAAAAQLDHMLPLLQMKGGCICMSDAFNGRGTACVILPYWGTPAICLADGLDSEGVSATKAILGSSAPAT